MDKLERKTDTVAIKKLMIENGCGTVSELAEKTGINRNTLAKVLNGQTQPTSYVMYKLVDIFQIAPEEAGAIFFAPNLRET